MFTQSPARPDQILPERRPSAHALPIANPAQAVRLQLRVPSHPAHPRYAPVLCWALPTARAGTGAPTRLRVSCCWRSPLRVPGLAHPTTRHVLGAPHRASRAGRSRRQYCLYCAPCLHRPTEGGPHRVRYRQSVRSCPAFRKGRSDSDSPPF